MKNKQDSRIWGKGSSQGYRSASYILEQVIKGKDCESEHLCRQVSELELEVWRRCRRRNCNESTDDSYHARESRRESSLTKVVRIDQKKIERDH